MKHATLELVAGIIANCRFTHVSIRHGEIVVTRDTRSQRIAFQFLYPGHNYYP
jgi:hypothetical protein